jgi:hypothetical protein
MKYHYPSLHQTTKKMFLSLCTLWEIIGEISGEEGYSPIRLHFDHFIEWIRWTNQGMGNAEEPRSAVLRVSTLMVVEYLVGHKADSTCQWGKACKGGADCDEKMDYSLPETGHLGPLPHYHDLIKGLTSRDGAFRTYWQMGSAILGFIQEKEERGFVYPILQDPPRSIWSSLIRDYCAERYGKAKLKSHDEVWKPFRDRIVEGLVEVGSEVVADGSIESYLDRW